MTKLASALAVSCCLSIAKFTMLQASSCWALLCPCAAISSSNAGSLNQQQLCVAGKSHVGMSWCMGHLTLHKSLLVCLRNLRRRDAVQRSVLDSAHGSSDNALYLWSDMPRFEVSNARLADKQGQALKLPDSPWLDHALFLSDQQV